MASASVGQSSECQTITILEYLVQDILAVRLCRPYWKWYKTNDCHFVLISHHDWSCAKFLLVEAATAPKEATQPWEGDASSLGVGEAPTLRRDQRR